MSRYLMAVIAALSIALAGAGWLLKRAYTANGAQTVQIHSLQEAQERAAKAAKRDRALLAQRGREIAAYAAAAASARASLSDSLQRNPAWADQPVPQEVQDALSRP